MRLGDLVAAKRKRMGLSQRQLAVRLGVNHSHLARIESGFRFPLRFITALADSLGISEDDLRKRVLNEKFIEQVEGPYISPTRIETIANGDRAAALKALGRNYFRFPKDSKSIPSLLCGLQVEESDMLFNEGLRKIFAGLFPEPLSFQTQANVIAVATNQVKTGRREIASEQTKLFQILHELGHFRLHWSQKRFTIAKARRADAPLYCSWGDSSRPELQANEYASCFLMPKSEILEYLDDTGRINLKRLGKEICERFYVEPWMIQRRLQNLGIRMR